MVPKFDFSELRSLGMFKNLSEKGLELVSTGIKIVSAERETVVCTEGSPSKSMYFIMKGKAEVFKKGVPLATLDEGDYFGEMSLLEEGRRTASVKAIEPTTLYEISKDTFDEVVKVNPDALRDIVLTLDRRLRDHNTTVVNQYIKLKEQFTELEEQHKQLLRTEKLASVGMLTAGIAHEVNNPLTVIVSFVDLLDSKSSEGKIDDAFLKKGIDCIGRSAESIRRIVASLKTFIRMDGEDSYAMGLNDTIQSSLELVSYLYKKEQIEVTTEFYSKELVIESNKGKFQQVIMNLLSNAKDALEGQKTKKIKISTNQNGANATVTVADTGCGIKEDVLGKIFDKFYTTKKVGHGTGLGLDIIKGIIEEMDGTVEVQSTIGTGTTFTLTFPTV